MNFIVTENELNTKQGITILYFYAPWLLVHKKMMGVFSAIEPDSKDTAFYAIDVDSFKGLCTRFNIDSIPKIVILTSDGKVFKTINGLVSEANLRTILNDIYSVYAKKKWRKNDQQESNKEEGSS